MDRLSYISLVSVVYTAPCRHQTRNKAIFTKFDALTLTMLGTMAIWLGVSWKQELMYVWIAIWLVLCTFGQSRNGL